MMRSLSIVLSLILLILLSIILILSIYIFHKKETKEFVEYSHGAFLKEIYEQYASVYILEANQYGFKIKNDGYVTLTDVKVYENERILHLNNSVCRKICSNCSNDFSILEVNATIVCNISLTPGNLLIVLAKYASDRRKIVGVIVIINATIVLQNVTILEPLPVILLLKNVTYYINLTELNKTLNMDIILYPEIFQRNITTEMNFTLVQTK